MASESTGSCAAAPPPPRTPLPLPAPPHPPNRSSPCFRCNQEGHWYKDCPRRPRSNPTSPHTLPPKPHPELNCRCGRGPCAVRTSHTPKNPNRDFYTCPATPMSEQCGFFAWCDAGAGGLNSPVKRKLQYDADRKVGVEMKGYGVEERPVPVCGCGAGSCRLLTVQDGVDAGRKYFGCPIKKGQGACNFRQWYDDIAAKPAEMDVDLCDNEVPNVCLVTKDLKNFATSKSNLVKDDEVQGSNVSVIPATPLPSERQHHNNLVEGNDFSTMKRLRLSPMRMYHLNEANQSSVESRQAQL